jgi:hypothetical protein
MEMYAWWREREGERERERAAVRETKGVSTFLSSPSLSFHPSIPLPPPAHLSLPHIDVAVGGRAGDPRPLVLERCGSGAARARISTLYQSWVYALWNGSEKRLVLLITLGG